MKEERERFRQQFISQPVTTRLRQLITHLSNIQMQVREPVDSEQVRGLVRECMFFTEYIAPDVKVDLQIELAELQRQMAHWYHHWESVISEVAQQIELAEQAGDWSKRIGTATEDDLPAREVA